MAVDEYKYKMMIEGIRVYREETQNSLNQYRKLVDDMQRAFAESGISLETTQSDLDAFRRLVDVIITVDELNDFRFDIIDRAIKAAAENRKDVVTNDGV